jgi:hypothetical protein
MERENNSSILHELFFRSLNARMLAKVIVFRASTICKTFHFVPDMAASPRQIPMEITLWMEKDVQLPKLDAKASMMPTDTKQNTILNRKFFADMFDLSSQRYRSINRSELEKQNFLQQQQARAESGMPGLLPYVHSCLSF